jgi:hypothetical protein
MSANIIHLENGKLADDTPRARVHAIVQSAVASNAPAGTVVHFHGGLVKYASGVEIANRMTVEYEAGGGYSVFFVWESGLPEILLNNARNIAKESFFNKVWKRLVRVTKRKFAQGDGDRAAGMLPAVDTRSIENDIDQAIAAESLDRLLQNEPAIPDGVGELTPAEQRQLEAELQRDRELTAEVQRITNGLRTPAEIEADRQARSATVQASTATLMDPDAVGRLVDRPQAGTRGILSAAKVLKAIVVIAAKCVKRFATKRHHGLHATLVEEILRELYVANIGGKVWKMMKDDTADAFKPDADTYGGTAFLTELASQIEQTAPPRITLVGHSTGAIYISEFLAHAETILDAAVKFDVIFLAPASTFEKTASTLCNHRERIGDFRMFAMEDAVEKKDRLIPILYPHSLLYFVSGVVEGGSDVPIVGMQRFYDAAHFPDAKFPAVKTVRDFVQVDPKHSVWSKTTGALEGLRSHSERHGDFDNDEVTLGSLRHILQQGF